MSSDAPCEEDLSFVYLDATKATKPESTLSIAKA